MVMCCTAASAPPAFWPLRIRMSPMWLTSNTPTLRRTALCSATKPPLKPPLKGYSTGMSQPPKLTIFALRRRCNAFSGVLRSALMGEVVEESIPIARAGIDTNMHFQSGQRSRGTRVFTKRMHGSQSPRHVHLAAKGWLRYSFLEGTHGRSYRLCAMRHDGRALHLRAVLYHLQGTAQHPSLFRRPLLLSGLPGSLRRCAG